MLSSYKIIFLIVTFCILFGCKIDERGKYRNCGDQKSSIILYSSNCDNNFYIYLTEIKDLLSNHTIFSNCKVSNQKLITLTNSFIKNELCLSCNYGLGIYDCKRKTFEAYPYLLERTDLQKRLNISKL